MVMRKNLDLATTSVCLAFICCLSLCGVRGGLASRQEMTAATRSYNSTHSHQLLVWETQITNGDSSGEYNNKNSSSSVVQGLLRIVNNRSYRTTNSVERQMLRDISNSSSKNNRKISSSLGLRVNNTSLRNRFRVNNTSHSNSSSDSRELQDNNNNSSSNSNSKWSDSQGLPAINNSSNNSNKNASSRKRQELRDINTSIRNRNTSRSDSKELHVIINRSNVSSSNISRQNIDKEQSASLPGNAKAPSSTQHSSSTDKHSSNNSNNKHSSNDKHTGDKHSSRDQNGSNTDQHSLNNQRSRHNQHSFQHEHNFNGQHIFNDHFSYNDKQSFSNRYNINDQNNIPGQHSNINTTTTTVPQILTPSFTQLSTRSGQTTVFTCVVTHLGNRQVSWIRERDLHVLSSGKVTFSSDSRVGVSRVGDSWRLTLRYTQTRDAGRYGCQINTQPSLAVWFNLTVLEAHARIVGKEQVYVQAGSTISLHCIVREQLAIPGLVLWYHNILLVNRESGRVRVETTLSNTTTTSILTLKPAITTDSGNYSCWPSAGRPHTVLVHVIRGDLPAAMYHGSSVPLTCCGFLLVAPATAALTWLLVDLASI